MKNIIRFAMVAVISVSVIFYSCQKDISGNTSDVNKPHGVTIYLTDHQTPVFDSVFVDLQGLEVKLEDDTLPNSGWVNLNINPGVYNILRFRNGLDTLFAIGTLPNARVKKVKLILGTQNSVMKNGQVFPLRIKDEDREVIANLDASNFEITTSGQVLFWIDFDAGNSIQVDNSGSGNNNGYRLKSHIKIFTRSHSGEIEGKVLPLAADPIVKAVIGSDTATAIPDDDDGEFKIVGLTAGTYKLIIDGQNGYNDTTINNVIVRNREDTHLPAILLHQ
ncbi:MAG TPA: DUF4382 domain-containing protein [Chitinophagaceae bacterium]|nr:DUF4382 domain-containing protein [Chitinophagaceae bacterium]HNU15639.1 DUF4382 domain-containing protein [Chitinophagaceae bacterium]